MPFLGRLPLGCVPQGTERAQERRLGQPVLVLAAGVPVERGADRERPLRTKDGEDVAGGAGEVLEQMDGVGHDNVIDGAGRDVLAQGFGRSRHVAGVVAESRSGGGEPGLVGIDDDQLGGIAVLEHRQGHGAGAPAEVQHHLAR